MEQLNIKMKLLILISCVIVVCLGELVSEKLTTKESDEKVVTEEVNKPVEDTDITSNSNNTSNKPVIVEINNKTSETDLFANYYNKVDKIIENMNLEEKVLQLFIVPYTLDSKDEVGGYILSKDFFENENKITALNKINELQNNKKIKMFITVEEEGGNNTVVSSNKNFRAINFLSSREIYNQGGMDLLVTDIYEKTNLLKSIGINMNLYPVADISNELDSYMYLRSLGEDVEVTSNYIEEVVNAMNNKKMISVIKHFPGYGNSNKVNEQLITDERSYEELKENDLKPFIAGINSSSPIILMSNSIFKNIDSENPTSLSNKMHEILRKELNFTGIIMIDDKDLINNLNNKNIAKEAILSGNDIIITSNYEKYKEEIINLIKSGEIPEEIIDNSVRRIIACKYAYGIMEG